MQSSEMTERLELGSLLRRRVRALHEESGRSLRHISRSIGADSNYLTSYLSNPPEKWAIPKHPTYQNLLSELGVTEEQLLQEIRDGVSAGSDAGGAP